MPGHGSLLRCYSASGQSFLRAAEMALEKPPAHEAVYLLLDIIGTYFAGVREAGAVAGFEREDEAMRALSCLSNDGCRPHLDPDDRGGAADAASPRAIVRTAAATHSHPQGDLMKGGVYLDAEAPHLVKQSFAVVNVKRGSRKRFAENCVAIVADAAAALAGADAANNLHAAEVMGPSRSSEGFNLYYLVRWLED